MVYAQAMMNAAIAARTAMIIITISAIWEARIPDASLLGLLVDVADAVSLVVVTVRGICDAWDVIDAIKLICVVLDRALFVESGFIVKVGFKLAGEIVGNEIVIVFVGVLLSTEFDEEMSNKDVSEFTTE
ncbi:hypothetical protein HK098_006706 [Nowakowskiella sp. JEL0407]|nr:hypothetical protein HK098_006706 [Nowakowskiella sp. JEL0407]